MVFATGGGLATSIGVQRPWKLRRTALPNKELSGSSVKSVRVEKPWPRERREKKRLRKGRLQN